MSLSRAALLVLAPAVMLIAACKPPAPAAPVAEPASIETAEQCYRDQDWACAQANYAGYLKQYPNDANKIALLAFSLTRGGKHKEALPWYEKGIAAGVGTYDFYAHYAMSLDAVGDTEGAIKRNRQALDLVPSLVDVRGSLAQQLVKQGKRAEAIKLLKDFDRELVSKGEQPYFRGQIAAIEEGGKGQ